MLQLQNIILHFYQESGHNQSYILSRNKMLYPMKGFIWPQTRLAPSSVSHILQMGFSMKKKPKTNQTNKNKQQTPKNSTIGVFKIKFSTNKKLSPFPHAQSHLEERQEL